MTDQKLSQLTAVTTLAVTDIVYAVASSNSRKITVANAGKYITPITTQGDLVVGDGTSATRLALGAANLFLVSDGTDPNYRGGTEIVSDADVTVEVTDHMRLFRLGPGAADKTATLPTSAAAGNGFIVGFIMIGTSTGNGIISRGVSGTITAPGGDVASITMTARGDHVWLMSTGTGFWATMSYSVTP